MRGAERQAAHAGHRDDVQGYPKTDPVATLVQGTEPTGAIVPRHTVAVETDCQSAAVAIPGLSPADARQGPPRLATGLLQAAKRHKGRIVAALLLVVLLLLALALQSRLAGCYPGWSLRWHTPIDGQSAAAARQYAIAHPEQNLWPTFWREDTLPVESDLFDASARCISYSGEGDLAWPARFERGGWPGATDTGSCAISSALAYALWGSHDVLGKAVTISGKSYTVRGVFTGDSPLCLLPTEDTGAAEGWQAAEFRARPGLYREDITTFAQSGGLATADTVVDGGQLVATLRFFCWLPVVIVALWLLLRMLRTLAGPRPGLLKWAALVLVLLLVLALPALLAALPPWLLPNKWSDFAFWGGLFQQLGDSFTEFLSVVPGWRDVAGKKALLGCAAACLAALVPAVMLAKAPTKKA